jgi:Zn-finger nucleic acid-binding protein
MVAPDQPHIEYESCGTCFGAYFDAGEFTDLKEHSLSDVVRRLVRKVRG